MNLHGCIIFRWNSVVTFSLKYYFSKMFALRLQLKLFVKYFSVLTTRLLALLRYLKFHLYFFYCGLCLDSGCCIIKLMYTLLVVDFKLCQNSLCFHFIHICYVFSRLLYFIRNRYQGFRSFYHPTEFLLSSVFNGFHFSCLMASFIAS